MKGTMFVLLEDFISERLGDDGFDGILDDAGLAQAEPFVGPGDYPVAHLVALTEVAARRMGVGVDDLHRQLGRYAFPALARSVPTLMDGLDTPRQFLDQLDNLVEIEVHKLNPAVEPPRFTILAEVGNELLLEYESSSGLFPLVGGLLDGMADWYRVPVDNRLVSTQGTNGTYLLTFRAEPPRHSEHDPEHDSARDPDPQLSPRDEASHG